MEDVVQLAQDDEEIDITEGQTNAILGKLEQAVDKIESDNLNAAINSINAFINQINAFINSGQIDSNAGGILIEAAEGIIATLNAM
jgi:ABC-type transporter Mla subunit MlaD